MRCLKDGGVLYFSTNFRKFQMDQDVADQFNVEDITKKTIPEDFRNDRIHYCWVIKHVIP